MSLVTFKGGICALGVIWLSCCNDGGKQVDAPEKQADGPLKQVEKILAEVEGVANPPQPDEAVPVPDDKAERPGEIPVAEPVPGKPGFVISPFNGKWLDVTGLPAGETVADPQFPAGEKKYFRVPEAPAADTEPEDSEQVPPAIPEPKLQVGL